MVALLALVSVPIDVGPLRNRAYFCSHNINRGNHHHCRRGARRKSAKPAVCASGISWHDPALLAIALLAHCARASALPIVAWRGMAGAAKWRRARLARRASWQCRPGGSLSSRRCPCRGRHHLLSVITHTFIAFVLAPLAPHFFGLTVSKPICAAAAFRFATRIISLNICRQATSLLRISMPVSYEASSLRRFVITKIEISYQCGAGGG